MVQLKGLLAILGLVLLVGCDNQPEPKPHSVVASEEIHQLVQFMADSASNCDMWLSQDDEMRRFFTENDSLANYLTRYFDHDQIVSWYQSVDTTTLLDLSKHLYNLDVPYVTHVDSLKSGCASTINAIAFSHQNKECLMLFVERSANHLAHYTFLLERPDDNWYIADTLNHVHVKH